MQKATTRRLAIPTFLAALSAWPATVSAQAGMAQTDSAAVVAAVEGFHSALAGGDTAAVQALLHPDVRILESGELETRDQYIGGHMGADMAFASAVPRQRGEIHVRVAGNTAWAVSTALTTGRYRDREVNSQSAELMVLVRESAAWRIAAIHWSSRARRN